MIESEGTNNKRGVRWSKKRGVIKEEKGTKKGGVRRGESEEKESVEGESVEVESEEW